MTDTVKNYIKSKEVGRAFFNAFAYNGWIWAYSENDYAEYDYYKLHIKSQADNYVYAVVSNNKQSFAADLDFGVVWLEVSPTDTDIAFGKTQLAIMQDNILRAEENLLTLGIPFEADYIFTGKNVANKKRKNEKARKLWGIDELCKSMKNNLKN